MTGEREDDARDAPLARLTPPVLDQILPRSRGIGRHRSHHHLLPASPTLTPQSNAPTHERTLSAILFYVSYRSTHGKTSQSPHVTVLARPATRAAAKSQITVCSCSLSGTDV